ncbi:MAG: class IV adenylate cyclase [Phycisphaerales bacterium]|nr:MAG: class IV adenylate cyclase [Phycisphaerales bacterium]
MKRNVEIKARLADPGAIRELVEQIADEGPAVIEQEDTFFHCERGRLKLRKFSESRGELIYYDRSDSTGPSECRYLICPTSEPASLIEILSRALGVRGVVRKRRTLYMVGQTRVHLDEVKQLGQFLELEVVLACEQSTSDGERIAERLMGRLGIKESDLIETAYIDLLDEAE